MQTKFKKIEMSFENEDLEDFVAEVGKKGVTDIFETPAYFIIKYGPLAGKAIPRRTEVAVNFWLEEVPNEEPAEAVEAEVVQLDEAKKNNKKRKL